MRPKTITISPDAADANGICESQTPTAGGSQDLEIAGDLASDGVATMDVPRHISIASDGNDSGRTFTITGTDRDGKALTEEITGPNGTTVKSKRNFKTITTVNIDDDSAGALLVGSADELESQWIPLDSRKKKISFFNTLSSGASLSYQLKYTGDDVFVSTFTEYGATKHNATGVLTTDNAIASDSPITAACIAITGYSSGTLTTRIVTSDI